MNSGVIRSAIRKADLGILLDFISYKSNQYYLLASSHDFTLFTIFQTLQTSCDPQAA
jgi:hypothetical protein